MKIDTKISRRGFVKAGATFGMLAGLGQFKLASAAPVQDYKALVCLFLVGGNDGHNLIVPLDPTQYAAYSAARSGLGIPKNQLLPVSDPALGPFGLHFSLPELQALYNQNKMAVMANVGGLVTPTTFANLSNSNFPLPTNLRSHSDQVIQMQTGITDASGSTGWGGRSLDLLQANNAGTTFPVSIAMNSPAIFCAGASVQGTSLQPGNDLDQNAMGIYPPAAAAARLTALQTIASTSSGNSIIDAANKPMVSALALNPLLKNASATVNWLKAFPQTSLGAQLQDIANIINLHSQLGIGRQVFFCSLGGFDTHSGQSWQQQDLFQQVSQALDAFYSATVQLGLDSQVTSFTLSDFGRTLQPNASGTDHGWGNHHFILGGAVAGGRIYGTFPTMTNYSHFNATNNDFADNRGVMLPNTSLSQYGATLAKWFGAADGQLDGLFPTLPNFMIRDVGFMG